MSEDYSPIEGDSRESRYQPTPIGTPKSSQVGGYQSTRSHINTPHRSNIQSNLTSTFQQMLIAAEEFEKV